ncbi:SDR family NAD(P)-dependent oxidoreductase [Hydrocarboniphaga sp.]|uniref:SDR family NAD(P)-dependent oxidoreductase n=1 Tax=Hydrocarboniphaga sp. TaxID=2033016 RepID=UPI003D0A0716
MTAYTLITGATSGIGLALAHEFARRGDALLLVARRAEALADTAATLRAQHGVEVLERVCDLADSASVSALIAGIERDSLRVARLINNAGFATAGAFVDQSWQAERDLLMVNVLSLTQLCHAIGGQMARAGGGHILNVASITGFMPGPWMSNYAASKSFVIILSESLREELAERGVKVSVLCPGTTRSPFFAKANIAIEKAAPDKLIMSPEEVARITVAAMERNPAIIVPKWRNKLLAIAPRLGPRWLLRKVVASLHKSVVA